MKKVLYISYDGMTDPLGQSQVIPYLKELTKEGYQFTILSVEKRDRYDKNGALIRSILVESGIQWETLFFTASPPLLSKLYDQYKLNAKARQLYQQQKFDFLHCRSYVAAATALKLKKKYNLRFLFDMRGFWVDERVDSGLWKRSNPLYNFLYSYYKKKELKYFKQSTHIISLTEKGKQELIDRYKVPAKKVTVIPCCADLDHFDYKKIDDESKQSLRTEWGLLPDVKIISYLGSLGGWYMTEEMLDFYAVIRKKINNTRFLFITHDAPEKIKNLAITKGISENEILVKAATRQQVPLYLSLSNWSIFFIKNLYSKKASSPTKQGEIMGMGIPIICNDIGDTGDILMDTKTGIVIKGFRNEDYVEAIKNIDALKLISKEQICAAAFRYYDLKKGAVEYIKSYKEVLV